VSKKHSPGIAESYYSRKKKRIARAVVVTESLQGDYAQGSAVLLITKEIILKIST
jgi:hypothetical protein